MPGVAVVLLQQQVRDRVGARLVAGVGVAAWVGEGRLDVHVTDVAILVGGAAAGDVRVVAPVRGVVARGVPALVEIDVGLHLAADTVPLPDQVPVHQERGRHVGDGAAGPGQDQFLVVVRAGHHGEVRYRVSARGVVNGLGAPGDPRGSARNPGGGGVEEIGTPVVREVDVLHGFVEDLVIRRQVLGGRLVSRGTVGILELHEDLGPCPAQPLVGGVLVGEGEGHRLARAGRGWVDGLGGLQGAVHHVHVIHFVGAGNHVRIGGGRLPRPVRGAHARGVDDGLARGGAGGDRHGQGDGGGRIERHSADIPIDDPPGGRASAGVGGRGGNIGGVGGDGIRDGHARGRHRAHVVVNNGVNDGLARAAEGPVHVLGNLHHGLAPLVVAGPGEIARVHEKPQNVQVIVEIIERGWGVIGPSRLLGQLVGGGHAVGLVHEGLVARSRGDRRLGAHGPLAQRSRAPGPVGIPLLRHVPELVGFVDPDIPSPRLERVAGVGDEGLQAGIAVVDHIHRVAPRAALALGTPAGARVGEARWRGGAAFPGIVHGVGVETVVPGRRVRLRDGRASIIGHRDPFREGPVRAGGAREIGAPASVIAGVQVVGVHAAVATADGEGVAALHVIPHVHVMEPGSGPRVRVRDGVIQHGADHALRLGAVVDRSAASPLFAGREKRHGDVLVPVRGGIAAFHGKGRGLADFPAHEVVL